MRSSPNNNKAQATLKAAYQQSQVWHQDQINNLRQSGDVFKWEQIADRYAQLNSLYDQISTCPSCLTVTGNPYALPGRWRRPGCKPPRPVMRPAKACSTKTNKTA